MIVAGFFGGLLLLGAPAAATKRASADKCGRSSARSRKHRESAASAGSDEIASSDATTTCRSGETTELFASAIGSTPLRIAIPIATASATVGAVQLVIE